MEAIGTLAGGIAHDFNNLLTTIQGNASLMLYDIEPSHPHFEPLRKIEKQVRKGAGLTSQLLGYARKGKYQVKTVNLNQIVADNCDTFARARKEITIRLDLASDVVSVEADQGQIEQILLNLFVNAADAMPDGGSLFVKTDNATHLEIKGNHFVPKPGNYVRLAVTDTGTGMDQKVQERIFDPFFTTKEMGRGSGLGLASVYGIIKNHDGYIEVESEPGKGTTFNIYLPASGKKVLKPDETSTRIPKGSETILLIDDEETVLEVGANILKKLGYTVIQAANAADAIDLFQKNKEIIDMVVLDMIMPVMSGGVIYDRLKEIDPNVKVLLSSGYSIDGQATEILNRGCDEFIQKPFSIKSLSEKIKSILVKE
jgi:CheY-like chemotaxis protein